MGSYSRASRRMDGRGATAAEYALLITLIAGVIFGAVGLFGGSVLGLFNNACNQVAAATIGAAC